MLSSLIALIAMWVESVEFQDGGNLLPLNPNKPTDFAKDKEYTPATERRMKVPFNEKRGPVSGTAFNVESSLPGFRPLHQNASPHKLGGAERVLR